MWRGPIIAENITQAAIDGSFLQERAIERPRHKLIIRKYDTGTEFRNGELYDVETDPRASVNLGSKQLRIVGTVESELESWCRKTQDNIGVELAHFALS